MATLSTTRNYADGDILLESDLDSFLDDIETFLNSTGLNDDNLQNGGITGSTKLVNASVTNSKMAANSVDTTQLVNDAVTNIKMADNSVNTAELVDDAVTTAKILDSNVTTAKIADSNVTTAKLADLNVTRPKLAAVGQQISTGSGLWQSTTSGTHVAITNMSISITTTGRPVILMVIPDNVALGGYGLRAHSGSGTSTFQYYRDSTGLGKTVFPNSGTSTAPAGFSASMTMIDIPSAGTYTYTLRADANGGTVQAYNMKLVAYEL